MRFTNSLLWVTLRAPVRTITVLALMLGWTPLAFACGLGPAPAPESVTCGDAPSAVVAIEGQPSLALEVAKTPEERARGLMFRQDLDWNSGMLFEFPSPSQGGFWMRNTLIPLSIAWLDANGTIVDIQDMQPQSDDVHVPSAPYVYALEANQGWFAANGVSPGQRVVLCPGGG